MRQRHFRNYGGPGEAVFVTTTCLDFAPLFQTEARRVQIARLLVENMAYYGSLLHAFVVMPEHVHWVCTTPPERDVSWLVNRFKANSGKLLAQSLTASEQDALSQQTGLNRRSVWQRSFRSYSLSTPSVERQKRDYIHENPVRRGLSACPFSYHVTSARFHEFGEWTHEFGLPADVEAILGCRWPWAEP